MFTPTLTALLIAVLPLASAYISEVQQFSGTYTATPTTSTFPVTFVTASTKVELYAFPRLARAVCR